MTTQRRHKLKVIVTGDVGSGKKRLIHTLSQARDNHQEPVIQNFGRVELAYYDNVRLTVYLLASLLEPEQDGVLNRGTADDVLAIVMVNSTNPASFRTARRTIRYIERKTDLLYVVAASFQDAPDAWHVDDLRRPLRVADDVPIVPCVATNFESAHHVLHTLLERFAWQVAT